MHHADYEDGGDCHFQKRTRGAGFQNIYSKVYIWRIVPKSDSKVYICGIVHSLKQQLPLFLPWHALALSLRKTEPARPILLKFATVSLVKFAHYAPFLQG